MRRAALALLATLAVVVLGASASAQPERVAGSRATLETPPGFRTADAFAGFQHDGLSASLVVAELAGAPLQEMLDGMTAEAFATQGVEVTERREVRVQGAPAVLMHGAQRAYGVLFDKWILVAGDANGVVMVTAALPAEHAKHGPALERAVLSLAWGGEPPADLFEGLGFTIDLPPDLTHRQRVGATLLLAEEAGPNRDGAPVYIAGLGAAPLVGDLAAQTARRLRQTAGVRDLGAVAGQAVSVGGVGGWEAVAAGRDVDSGDPVTVYLVLAPTEAGYVILQRIVRSGLADQWLPRFRALTASLDWRTP